MDRSLGEDERHPLAGEAGRGALARLYEHPHGPRFSHQCGDRLGLDGLSRVRAYAATLSAPDWRPGEPPEWVTRFAAACLADVPFYRARGGDPAALGSIPPCERSDLAREPWRFVPDGLPLQDLIVYTSAGTTTGSPLDVLSSPETSSLTLPLLERALALHGVRLEGGSGRASIVLVCAQRKTYTYASLSSYLGGAAFLKLNLDPRDWPDPADRARFLDELDPEVYTGDPVSFLWLARLPLNRRPKALISTAMALLPGHRALLERRFGCPVLDVYSLNECGPVAVARDGLFAVLPPDLYVEVLDDRGDPCPPGVRGEVTLTGGRNPYLPLLRYRTADYAELTLHGGGPALAGLQGRAPVVFRNRAGDAVNNIDVAAALKPLALAEYSLVQDRDGALCLTARGAETQDAGVRQALLPLFGPDQPLTLEERDDVPSGKLMPFRCELDWDPADAVR